MNRRQLLAAALVLTALVPPVSAQTKYPQRPITLIVPTAPGGTTDYSARLISDALGRALGQPVIVDNRPGGSGNIGNQLVARAKPDGYTLLVSYSGYHVANPHLFKQAGWDPIKDFAPVALLTRAPQVIAVSSKLPVRTVQELVAYAKANPGKLNYASAGNGSIQHVAGELFKQVTGTQITHIPYKGSGPAVQDLMGGMVDIFITTPAGVQNQIQSGHVKGLAVTGPARLSSLPNVPTASEAGLKGYELDSWFALYAPAGTPPEIIQQLNREVNKILQTADVRKRAEESGTSVDPMTPEQLGDLTKRELDRWGKVIKSAHIAAD